MRMTKAERRQAEQEAFTHLTEMLPPGSTIFCPYRGKSAYGVFTLHEGRIVYLTGYVARLLKLRLLHDPRDSVRVDGANDIARNLSLILHGRGEDPRWVRIFHDYMAEHNKVPWHLLPGKTINFEVL